MAGKPQKYFYPERIGEETRNPAADKTQAKRIMKRASERAQNFRVVYRCRRDGDCVVIRRAA